MDATADRSPQPCSRDVFARDRGRWVALAVELQRDCAHEETVADLIEIVLIEGLLTA